MSETRAHRVVIVGGGFGAVGILTNSQILIVGAMVVGPEYNAIMGIALGSPGRLCPAGRVLGRDHRDTDLRAGHPLVRPHARGILARRAAGLEPDRQPEPVFPDSRVLAGIVGVVSLTEAKSAALIGVFISVTTIPAAADTGLSIAYANRAEARGSALQLLLNVTVLIAIGALGLRLRRIIWRLRSDAEGHATDAPGV
jgi:Domain of unknown function (DUF389)